jgi:phosphonate metabolism protein PhnN/1,5-bisphosphokinase (PRPP-forming)
LVVVVGPSGAGKDSLIAGARALLSADSRFFFPRRVITRTADRSEDHESITVENFADAERNGEFFLSWSAHGLSYGLPAHVAERLRNGQVVVCNLSRTIIAAARQRFAPIFVVLVTAPADLRAERLAARGREPSVTDRLDRTVAFDAEKADFELANGAAIEAAIQRFTAYLQHVADGVSPARRLGASLK